MTERERFEELRAILRDVAHLEAAAALLDWDQQTYMPPAGAEARAAQLATLRRLAHERLAHPRVGELVEALAEFERRHPPDSFEASLIRVARRRHRQAARVPPALVEELTRVTAQAFHAWVEARQADRFERFRPHLERVLALVVETADHLGWQGERYDALLDLYEPETTAAEVARLFEALREPLVAMVRRIPARDDATPDLRGSYPVAAQEAFCREVVEAMGFDLRRGRLDRSEHPFSVALGSPDDVRLTTRYREDDFTPALFAAIHEAGHGLYEQGIPRELAGTPLFEAASLGVHESQSRLWENVVARSRPFWQHFLPRLRRAFPDALAGIDLDGLYRAVNRVRPSPIRVDADEVTYNLHIMLRFDLERQLVEGRLAVADLPEAWSDGMERYLGIRPSRDVEGVLQDVHWAFGSFGYFPTYALGNLLAAALWEAARRDHPDLEERLAAGDLRTLREWLRERIHVHGAKFTPKELVRRVTGGPLEVGPFLAYLRGKYGPLYGI